MKLLPRDRLLTSSCIVHLENVIQSYADLPNAHFIIPYDKQTNTCIDITTNLPPKAFKHWEADGECK